MARFIKMGCCGEGSQILMISFPKTKHFSIQVIEELSSAESDRGMTSYSLIKVLSGISHPWHPSWLMNYQEGKLTGDT